MTDATNPRAWQYDHNAERTHHGDPWHYRYEAVKVIQRNPEFRTPMRDDPEHEKVTV